MTHLTGEKLKRYNDYKRGWLDGAQGKGPLVALGTPAPEFEDEYRRGFDDGAATFNEAMKNAFNRFKELA